MRVNNRSFDPFSLSYRAGTEALVSSATASTLGLPIYVAGNTYRYAPDAIAPNGYTLISDTVLHDCHLLDNIVGESIANMNSAYSGTPGTGVNANFYGSAGTRRRLLGHTLRRSAGTLHSPSIPAIRRIRLTPSPIHIPAIREWKLTSARN